VDEDNLTEMPEGVKDCFGVGMDLQHSGSPAKGLIACRRLDVLAVRIARDGSSLMPDRPLVSCCNVIDVQNRKIPKINAETRLSDLMPRRQPPTTCIMHK
jgi:hypothetical protein